MTNEIDVTKIKRVFGDRILVRRKGEPEKKRGILVPMSVKLKKEPRKIWWAEVVAFGEKSTAAEKSKVAVGDVVGLEPIGHHYAGWKGADGHDYAWVPEEHLALADFGSVAAYYADDRAKLGKATPELRVLGRRVLARRVEESDTVRGVVRAGRTDDAEAKRADIIALGEGTEDDPLPVSVGARVVHVEADAGSSAEVDIFDPPLLLLRAEDLIGEEYEKVVTEKEVARA